jgi:hypothetical protein
MAIQKKVCILGSFAVGKTSLIARFVRHFFSDNYLTTIGVTIETKVVKTAEGKELKLVLWDMAGDDGLSTVSTAFLRGASGYFLVVDGTRHPTWDTALELNQKITQEIGEKPFVILLNKADLEEQWEIKAQLVAEQRQQGRSILYCSAKTGAGVEEAFTQLATKLLEVN